MGSEAGYLPAALEEGGGYLPYHFSGPDFGAKIQKSQKKFVTSWQKPFFRRRAVSSSACLVRPRGGGGRHVLAAASIGVRGGMARARQQPVTPMVPWHQGPEATEKRIRPIVDFSVTFFSGRQIDRRKVIFFPGVLGTRAPYYFNPALGSRLQQGQQ